MNRGQVGPGCTPRAAHLSADVFVAQKKAGIRAHIKKEGEEAERAPYRFDVRHVVWILGVGAIFILHLYGDDRPSFLVLERKGEANAKVIVTVCTKEAYILTKKGDGFASLPLTNTFMLHSFFGVLP